MLPRIFIRGCIRRSVHPYVCPSVLPSEALQDLFEVLLGLLRLPEALGGSQKPSEAPLGSLRFPEAHLMLSVAL